MNPAERLAALRLLEHGLKAAITEAQAEADDYRQHVGARALTTPWGEVGLTRRKPAIVFDDAALLEWCETNAPEAIRRTVPTEARRGLAAKLTIDGDDVVDPATGEVVEFASVRPGGESLRVALTGEAKDEAEAALLARLAELADAVVPMLGGAA